MSECEEPVPLNMDVLLLLLGTESISDGSGVQERSSGARAATGAVSFASLSTLWSTESTRGVLEKVT